MIYLTSDLHGNQRELTRIVQRLRRQSGTKYLFIAGDFGFLLTGSRQEQFFLDDLERVSDIVFVVVPGNHEGYPNIQQYPVQNWNGANVRRVRENIVYLERGEIVTVEGRSVFGFGGACSRDKAFRKENGWPWYAEELPSEEEYANGFTVLQRHHGSVDLIITHSPPGEVQKALGIERIAEETQLNCYLDEILKTVQADTWFFGHYHLDCEMEMYGTRLVGVKNKLHQIY